MRSLFADYGREVFKRTIFIAAFAALFFFSAFALAGIEDQVPTESFLFKVFQFFSTVGGQTTIALVMGVSQLVMWGFQTPLASVAGKWRLTIVALCAVVFTVAGAMVTGLPLMGALGTAPVLAALQVFANQVWKQFFTDKGDVVPVSVVGR